MTVSAVPDRGAPRGHGERWMRGGSEHGNLSPASIRDARETSNKQSERIAALETTVKKINEENKKVLESCRQLQAEHEWIVRKLDAECAKVGHVEELYEEVERLHARLDAYKARPPAAGDVLPVASASETSDRGIRTSSGSSSSSSSSSMDRKPPQNLLGASTTSQTPPPGSGTSTSTAINVENVNVIEQRVAAVERELTAVKKFSMPASKEILLVAEHMERANAKLNDYSFQLESRMKFLEEKITKFEQKHEEEPLVALRKSLSEQQVRPSSKEVEDGGRDQGQGHLQGVVCAQQQVEHNHNLLDGVFHLLDGKYNRRLCAMEDAQNEKMAELLRRVNQSLSQIVRRGEEVAVKSLRAYTKGLDQKFSSLGGEGKEKEADAVEEEQQLLVAATSSGSSASSDHDRILTDAQWPGAVLQRIEACQKGIEACQKGIEVCQKGIQKCLVKIQLAEANVSKALTNFNKALDYRYRTGGGGPAAAVFTSARSGGGVRLGADVKAAAHLEDMREGAGGAALPEPGARPSQTQSAKPNPNNYGVLPFYSALTSTSAPAQLSSWSMNTNSNGNGDGSYRTKNLAIPPPLPSTTRNFAVPGGGGSSRGAAGTIQFAAAPFDAAYNYLADHAVIGPGFEEQRFFGHLEHSPAVTLGSLPANGNTPGTVAHFSTPTMVVRREK